MLVRPAPPPPPHLPLPHQHRLEDDADFIPCSPPRRAHAPHIHNGRTRPNAKAHEEVGRGRECIKVRDEELERALSYNDDIGSGNWGRVLSVTLLIPDIVSLDRRVPLGKPGEVYAAKVVDRTVEKRKRVQKIEDGWTDRDAKKEWESEKRDTVLRIRALWTEFEILRSLPPTSSTPPTSRRHPLIPFPTHFILTPSHALMLLPLYPEPMPVRVLEQRARPWFKCLLDGVRWLHARGIVHNDIKPSNILLTSQSQPILVDFGFAQQHDPSNPSTFLSELAVGTPEYLSPERARQQTHDTRKSDTWSLGVTIFEILVGRTPFEAWAVTYKPVIPKSSPHTDANKGTNVKATAPLNDANDDVEYEWTDPELDLGTQEGLLEYYNRTVSGNWVGKWEGRLSMRTERLLRRMLAPNADVRPLVDEALRLAERLWQEDDADYKLATPNARVNDAILKRATDPDASSGSLGFLSGTFGRTVAAERRGAIALPANKADEERPATPRKSRGPRVKQEESPIPKSRIPTFARTPPKCAAPPVWMSPAHATAPALHPPPQSHTTRSASPTKSQTTVLARGKENAVPTPSQIQKAAGSGKELRKRERAPLGLGGVKRGDVPPEKEKESVREKEKGKKRPPVPLQIVIPPPPPPARVEAQDVSFSAPDTVIIPPLLFPKDPNLQPAVREQTTMEVFKETVAQSLSLTIGSPRPLRPKVQSPTSTLNSARKTSANNLLATPASFRAAMGANNASTASNLATMPSSFRDTNANDNESRVSVATVSTVGRGRRTPSAAASAIALNESANSSVVGLNGKGKGRELTDLKGDRMAAWLRGLDKTVAETKASLAEPSSPKLPIPRRSRNSKGARPAAQNLFTTPSTSLVKAVPCIPAPIIVLKEEASADSSGPPTGTSATTSQQSPAKLASPTVEASRIPHPPLNFSQPNAVESNDSFEPLEPIMVPRMGPPPNPRLNPRMTSRLSTMSQLKNHLDDELMSIQNGEPSPATTNHDKNRRYATMPYNAVHMIPSITISRPSFEQEHTKPEQPPAPPSKSRSLANMRGEDVAGVYENFLMSTSAVVRVGKGYQSGNGTVTSSRVGKGIQSGAVPSTDSLRNRFMTSRSEKKRANSSGKLLSTESLRARFLTSRSGRDEQRRESIVSFFNLPSIARKDPKPATPATAPTDTLSPPHQAPPPPRPQQPSPARQGGKTVLKFRQAIKSIIHRRQSVVDDMGPGFVAVSPPRK